MGIYSLCFNIYQSLLCQILMEQDRQAKARSLDTVREHVTPKVVRKHTDTEGVCLEEEDGFLLSDVAEPSGTFLLLLWKNKSNSSKKSWSQCVRHAKRQTRIKNNYFFLL